MTRPVLILRPEPGAGQTAARARALGLEPATAPMFEVQSLDWDAPDAAEYDAVLLTSANAARLGGSALGDFTQLPCYCVGEATATAAQECGFSEIRTGPSDGAALLRLIVEEGVARALHLHGQDHIPLHHPRLSIEGRAVYASVGAESLPAEAVAAIGRGALVLLHSPRAAGHFARLLEKSGMTKGEVDLALISEAAAMEAGPDWKSVSVAPAPRDDALLELAAKLCKTGGAIHGN